MADKDNPHFNQIYYYIVLTTVLVFGYIAAVTFLNIPKENVRTVDTVTGFLLGTVVSAGVGYLLGGNPSAATIKKTSVVPENSDTTITTTNNENTTETIKPE